MSFVVRIDLAAAGCLLLAWGALVGCDRAKPAQPHGKAQAAEKPSDAKAGLTKPKPQPLPSEEECEEYVEGFVGAIESGDDQAIKRLIDWDQVLERATQGVDVPQKFRDAFMKGARKGVASDRNILIHVSRMVAAGGEIAPKETVVRNNQAIARFRLILPNGGANFLEVPLGKSRDGSVVGTDLFSLASGEHVSESMRRLYLVTAAEANQSLLDRLTGAEKVFATHGNLMGKMNDAVLRRGDFQGALDIFAQMPQPLRELKAVQLARLAAASNAGPTEYLDALTEFRGLFPQDPAADYHAIDFYTLRENYVEALDAAARVSDSVGGDVFFDVLGARLNLMQDDPVAARKCVEAAIDNDPTYLDAYWAAIDVELAEKDFAAVARLLDLIGERFSVEFEDLTTIEEYAEFAASPEGRQWIADHPPPAEDAADAQGDDESESTSPTP